MNQVLNRQKASGLYRPYVDLMSPPLTWCPLRGHTDEYQAWRAGEYYHDSLPLPWEN